MAPNPRVINAYNAMSSLGISVEEVKPVLKRLLQLYQNNWELIEEDNYRTLIDAYFELKEEDKQAEGKRKALINYPDGERPKQKLHLVDGDDQVSSSDNSKQELSAENTEIHSKTFKQEIVEPSQPCIGDIEATSSSQKLRTMLNEGERISPLPCKVARDGKLHPEKASAAGHCEDPIDKASNPHFHRKNISSDHHQKELMAPRTAKHKLHLGPVSKSYDGSSDVSKGNLHAKSLLALFHNVHKKGDSSACNNNNRTQKGDINIASSPLGEVKIFLNCDAALRQPKFHIPDLDAVMKSMEEKYLKGYKIVEPQSSMVKVLDDLCGSYLKLGLNLNRKGSHNVTCLPQQAVTEHENNSFHFVSDLTKGSENVKISLLDETGSEDLPKFNYIPNNVIYQDANVNISLARIADEGCCADCAGDCLSLPFPCACAQETGGEFAYTPQGLLNEDFLTVCMSMKMEPQDHHFVYCQVCPLERSKNDNKTEPCKGHLVRKFIKECWRKCGCDMQCGNRVVQRGLGCKLQVFLTGEGKGWGVRALEYLPKGCFVCEYAGEILTNTELYERIVQNSSNDRHTYPVTLDADWGSEGVLKDEEALCLDATYNGNVARFINHRCWDANLIDIPVEVETPDRHYYHLALFTNRNVNAYEELTWDYCIDFDDHEHPIQAFKCCCGSAFCRDKKQKGTNRSLKGKKHRE
ncbi:probable inactive histone-lysine N-methyltransferase SUVR1 [Cajanus cajan]|uniref:probable inactive histone-lysine N-methyltransferase SUVR1 n=1 Tax=Cajanus cajan TaxID=3821 RepID=UPI00098D98A7|nr:probable inactive histone-lysine N-methyltransferase SUVR1 [Cajanus cajan]XP_029125990.1 probable inactive histone-lysine N-methyltransferase SUVR1 [Cajanus cajan]XP_029125991.1 probable inactive histone-lysine N-methyltransferase SUVR1 [Cajanus cajan]XP_029125992.1 probable inactive histone-lysine N-methyltransferase SUVR1 [Cajanus cajan]